MSGIMESARQANLEELHELLDCVGNGFELSGLDEFDESSLGVLGSTLLGFFRHHEKLRCELEQLKRNGCDQPSPFGKPFTDSRSGMVVRK